MIIPETDQPVLDITNHADIQSVIREDSTDTLASVPSSRPGQIVLESASASVYSQDLTDNFDESSNDVASLRAKVIRYAARQMQLETEIEGLKTRISELESAIKTHEEETSKFKTSITALVELNQTRLNARLHNSQMKVSKQTIKPLVMANGKTPPNFPATRGEFEHLTKERYEAIMKAYELPIKGDIEAKRQALRTFLCLADMA